MGPAIVRKTPSLQFADPKQQARFELGVACAIFLWDELAIAVDNGWGGPESAEKREWTVGSVLELFTSAEVALEDVEYRLLGIMQDEFDADIETGTAALVAEAVLASWDSCEKQSYEVIESLYQRLQKRAETGAAKNIGTAEGSSDEEGSDDEGEEMDQTGEADQKMVQEPRNEPIVDDDGFTVVQKKRR